MWSFGIVYVFPSRVVTEKSVWQYRRSKINGGCNRKASFIDRWSTSISESTSKLSLLPCRCITAFCSAKTGGMYCLQLQKTSMTSMTFHLHLFMSPSHSKQSNIINWLQWVCRKGPASSTAWIVVKNTNLHKYWEFLNTYDLSQPKKNWEMTQYQDYGYSRPDTITTMDLQE